MHWIAFKTIRNKINNRQKYEERVWQKQKISECGNDTKKTWKNVKSILNWHSSGSPAKLFWKGEMKTKSLDIAECQNEHFLDKVRKIL